MWKRSDVERLTGLTRHMIQDLCNPNTSGDGLGFWEPAISKPGYSRFDEGDLLAFYLVRQLMKSGFTLKEIESAVFDLMEDDDSFERELRRKATVLHRHRAELDSKLSTLEYLEAAAASATDDRLYAVMKVALTQSAERAVQAATTEVQVTEADEELVRRGMRGLVAAVLCALCGEDSSAEDASAEVEGHGIAPLVAGWANTVVELLASDEPHVRLRARAWARAPAARVTPSPLMPLLHSLVNRKTVCPSSSFSVRGRSRFSRRQSQPAQRIRESKIDERRVGAASISQRRSGYKQR